MSRVARNLEQAFGRLPEPTPIRLQGSKLVFFSDLHRGVGDGADDFSACEAAYTEALDYYFDNGFTLFILGDADELWEVSRREWPDIFRIHSESIDREKAFWASDRYHRLFGNHDIAWANPDRVQKYLHPHFPGLTVVEAMTLEFFDGDDSIGKALLFHGHQGDFFSDDLRKLSSRFVREIWARLQRHAGIRSTDYSDLRNIRGEHNQAVYYDWAAAKPDFFSMMGHTHRMAFENIDGQEHRRGVEREIAKNDKLYRRLRDRDARHNYRMLRDTWKKRIKKAGFVDSDGVERMTPSFFNTGCSCFRNGYVSCLEISGGFLHLVRWDSTGGTDLEQARLREIFRQIEVAHA